MLYCTVYVRCFPWILCSPCTAILLPSTNCRAMFWPSILLHHYYSASSYWGLCHYEKRRELLKTWAFVSSFVSRWSTAYVRTVHARLFRVQVNPSWILFFWCFITNALVVDALAGRRWRIKLWLRCVESTSHENSLPVSTILYGYRIPIDIIMIISATVRRD